VSKLGCLLILALLWAGGQGSYEAIRYRQREETTCEAAQVKLPQSAWIHLSGCRVDLTAAAYKTAGSSPTGDIYVPLIPKEPGSRPVRIVLATRDPEIVTVVTDLAALDAKDKGALFAFVARNARRLVREKDVTGMLESGLDRDDKLHARLRELDKDLVEDFVVLVEGKEPHPMRSVALLAGGIALALFVSTRAARK